ncbi:MAG: hypothetical protein BGO98_48680 [Myxococcales bacterium 68-20]|nr:hypothetical protein [Myxococcales bacterium]OJY29707.1 MAG: hypothetical protein BGO98_48680 [Myxococcales bacterium 68-20]
MHVDRWEQGSDFAYPEMSPAASGAPRATWVPAGASFWHSGRHALRALIRALVPKRVLFPSFYCQDVLDAADEPGIQVLAYADGPEDERLDMDALELRAGDLLVVTNNYGTRRASPVNAPDALRDGVTLVEDHTHDPLSDWARSSAADYAFASLRKWLPLPDGGMLWSPARRPGVEAPAFDPRAHAVSAASTLDRLTGMLLKQHYLAGEPVRKDDYRARAIAGESAIGRGDPAPMSPMSRALLDLLPAEAWREARAKNHQTFAASLGEPPHVRLITATRNGVAPYSAVLCFDNRESREAVRSALVKQNIYPAVLWPIDGARAPGIPEAHVDLARRVLCLHCDHRYGASDMERVARAVRTAVESI